MELTDRNIRQLIKDLKEAGSNPDNYAFIARVADKFLGPNYRGRGRPRKSDYYYRKINWPESLKGNGMVYEEEV